MVGTIAFATNSLPWFLHRYPHKIYSILHSGKSDRQQIFLLLCKIRAAVEYSVYCRLAKQCVVAGDAILIPMPDTAL